MVHRRLSASKALQGVGLSIVLNNIRILNMVSVRLSGLLQSYSMGGHITDLTSQNWFPGRVPISLLCTGHCNRASKAITGRVFSGLSDSSRVYGRVSATI